MKLARFFLFSLIVTVLLPLSVWAQTVTLTGLKGPINHHQWQLKFNAAAQTHYHAFLLSNPSRLVIDFQPADQFHQQISNFLFAMTPMKGVRSAMYQPGQLRVVFDLHRPVSIVLAPAALQAVDQLLLFINDAAQINLKNQLAGIINGSSQPVVAVNRPFVTVVSSSASTPSPIKPTVAKTAVANIVQAPAKVATTKPVLVTVQPVLKSSRPVIVVIDPGHGGKDPGATGIHGTHEKDIVLSISKRMQMLLNRQSGFKAVLTRSNDSFIPLRQRMTIAHRDHADMFVAIHADAFLNHTAHGASVFALSQRGATSEAARWIAQRENQSELIGGVDLSNKENVLKSVLINLSQTATIHASLLIGQNMLDYMHSFAHLHHGSVEQAAFVVLKSPDIPSLLVETGFLSNPAEERNLRSSAYQQQMAQALVHGITRYFQQHPPPNTWLAWQRDHNDAHHYIVHRGDSLSAIAHRFHTSIIALKSSNHISNDQIRVGQQLVIP